MALLLQAQVQIPSNFIREVKLREVLGLLGDEDVASVLMQLVGTLRVVGALVKLAFALALKGLAEAGVELGCIDGDGGEYQDEGG